MFLFAVDLVCTPLPLDGFIVEREDFCVEKVVEPVKKGPEQVRKVSQVDMPYGFCLSHVRQSFGLKAVFPSASSAADATQFRHTGREMPDLFVPVWFDHWGTYQGVWGNWGHVVYWDPAKEHFVSTPIADQSGRAGVEYFGSLEEIEAVVGGSFRFWSEDVNGFRVVQL